MDRDALLSVVVALVCVAAVGMAAATMDSAVQTTPDDVIDVPASSVPLGSGQIRQYKERLQGGPLEGDSDASGAPSDRTTSAPKQRATSSPAPDQRDGGGDQQREETTQSRGPGPGPQQGSGPVDPSLLDRLLAFLRWLLDALLSALPLLAGAALLALAAANRERLAALFGGDGAPADASGVEAGRPDPQNDVAAAWYQMVARVGVERPETKTPRQCATAAVEAGADRSAVERLTRTFEEVRYGGAPVTDRRRRETRAALDALSPAGGEP